MLRTKATILALPLLVSPWLRFRGLKPSQRVLRGKMSESRFEISNDGASSSMEWDVLAGSVARPEVLYIFANAGTF